MGVYQSMVILEFATREYVGFMTYFYVLCRWRMCAWWCIATVEFVTVEFVTHSNVKFAIHSCVECVTHSYVEFVDQYIYGVRDVFSCVLVVDKCLVEHGDSLKFVTRSCTFICGVRDSFSSV